MDDNPIIRFPHPQQHAGTPTTDTAPARHHATARHDPAVPPGGHEPSSALLADSPLSVLLGAAGHSRACIMRIRCGRSLACSCDVAPEPLDDAAKAVGLAIRFAQMTATRQIAMPRGIVAALVEQVDAGNAAAILVWQWLARRGQIPAEQDLRPKLRLVREGS